LTSRSLTGFTVLEITIIVVVAAVLASLAVVAYFRVTSKAQDTEALNNLAAVRQAQVSEFAETGSYVNATDTAEINRLLPEADIQDKNFTYKVVNATAEDFAAVAARVGEDATGEKPIEIAMYSDGHVGYIPILRVLPMGAATAVRPAAAVPQAVRQAAQPAVCREGLQAALPAGHRVVHPAVLQAALPAVLPAAGLAAVLPMRTSRPSWGFFKGRPTAIIITSLSIRKASL
jgi:Tfp pilus assembly protein PilE